MVAVALLTSGFRGSGFEPLFFVYCCYQGSAENQRKAEWTPSINIIITIIQVVFSWIRGTSVSILVQHAHIDFVTIDM